MSDRPLRACDVCTKVDDHPRHVYDVGPAEAAAIPVNEDAVQAVLNHKKLSIVDAVRIVADLRDTTSQTRHLDCCAEAGCPDGTCDKILKDAGEKRGYELVAHITGEEVK